MGRDVEIFVWNLLVHACDRPLTRERERERETDLLGANLSRIKFSRLSRRMILERETQQPRFIALSYYSFSRCVLLEYVSLGHSYRWSVVETKIPYPAAASRHFVRSSAWSVCLSARIIARLGKRNSSQGHRRARFQRVSVRTGRTIDSSIGTLSKLLRWKYRTYEKQPFVTLSAYVRVRDQAFIAYT